MKFIPLFKVHDMRKALYHYTEILDFEVTCLDDNEHSLVVDIGHGGMEMQLTTIENDRLYGSVVYVFVDDVDTLFKKFLDRGLDISTKSDSPVHLAPINQTWGRREFYVTDDDGNTLRYCQYIT
ncbi:glyoxalase superfamily protein [Sediminibacterium goheungense]|uniref:Bleomycin resistance protein n=1 Tax=Sediminibacterium goheungense TaxID=1086393 RepID=A0A4R6IZ41_9BACT|nr:glyoxalase superfamily protein [Sediminibacterium goheungense]TDO28144.1 hypothetical protein BC659_0204 [Sediminibacterium goheungense]